MDEKYKYLNLQQQVGKNKADIEELRAVKWSLERAGVRVVGEEASASDLPDPVTYGGDLGDAYLIGSEPPYQMYIYTQPSVGETTFKWFNIGNFPAIGPRGPQGEPGPQGEQGDASNWRFGTVNPAILDTDKIHDGYLNTTTGMVYEFSGTNWVPVGSILGPRGTQGPEGPTGPEGPRGLQGEQGVQGPAGVVIEIAGVVETLGSLPDPDSVPRDTGYILDDGVNKDLYIIVEDENQDLTWYNAGPFTGTPGQAAGFGTISATVTPISPSGTPSVDVSTSGTDAAKDISFAFSLPVGAELDDTDLSMPSNTKGYTQKIISWRTLNRVLRNDNAGITFPTTTQIIISMMQSNLSYSMALISNDTNYGRILDTPAPKGQLFITQGSAMRNYDVKFVDDAYNVYIYAGASGTPETAQWYRLMTTHDAEIVGTPAGGTEHQLLAKKSDDDFDTEWVNVPNAPNGVPQGGTQGQILAKADGQNYNGEWVDAPNGIPNGGSQGQIMVKQSNADGAVAWQNPPVGLPAGGTTDQVLAKSSGTDFAVQWKTPATGIPSGGTVGQVLTKNSGDNYDASWQTPSGGGGGFTIIGENMVINPDFSINQRGVSGTVTASNNTTYTKDRWLLTNGSQLGVSDNIVQGTILQCIEIPRTSTHRYLLVGVTFDDNTATYDSAKVVIEACPNGSSTFEEITPVRDGTKYFQFATGFRDQYWAIIDMLGYQSSNLTSPYIKFKITKATGSNNVFKLYNAFCYNIPESYAASDIPAGIPVAAPNGAVELEKCKYYYEYINTNDNRLEGVFVTGASSTTRNIIINKIVSKKRINPTWIYSFRALYLIQSDGSQSVADLTMTYQNRIGFGYLSANQSVSNTTFVALRAMIQGSLDAEIYP